ncbi:MAG: hypothetical protein ACXU82_04885 [Caulobacteraceae bacterium]
MTGAGPVSARLAAAAALLLVLSAAAFPVLARARAPDPQSALVGVWAPDSRSEVLLAGAPLTPEGARLHAERLAQRQQPDPQFDRTRWCAGAGLPRIMLMPYPFEIRAERGYLAFLFGWYRWYRLVDLSGQAPEYALPTSMGYSVGRWSGPILEIKTVGLDDQTVLDASGLPHSDAMTLTERLRVLPDGRLEVRFTIEDAAFYTRPWTSVATYHRAPRVKIKDDVCPDRIARGEPAVAGKAP